MKVLLLIQNLARGGSERQLVVLAKGLREKGIDVAVGVFYTGGALEPELTRAGVRIIDLKKSGRWDLAGFLWRTRRAIAQEAPDVLYGFLPVANLVAWLAAMFHPNMRLIWGVRATTVDTVDYGPITRLTYWLERSLSARPSLIIVNSDAGRERHLRLGFPVDNISVVHNGIDTDTLRPDAEAGRRQRGEWGIGADEILIGLVARLDPIKDHATFLRAAAISMKTRPDLRFICVGGGPDRFRHELESLARDLGAGDRLFWAGPWHDMRAVYNALDIAVCSSSAEGFPNVVGEAMACTVPCVATDVGDCAAIIDDTGVVVPPGDPAALAAGWQSLLERGSVHRDEMGRRARLRIVDKYDTRDLVDRTLAALQSVFPG